MSHKEPSKNPLTKTLSASHVGERATEHIHRFDSVSGWCSGCNSRDDGRLISKGGDVWRPGRQETTA